MFLLIQLPWTSKFKMDEIIFISVNFVACKLNSPDSVFSVSEVEMIAKWKWKIFLNLSKHFDEDDSSIRWC